VFFKDSGSGSVRRGERSEGDEEALRPQPVVLSLCCGLRGRSYWSGDVGRGGEARRRRLLDHSHAADPLPATCSPHPSRRRHSPTA
jgi:hypothetical protein